MPPEEIIVDSSECCGNGCTNCILDISLINSRASRIKRYENYINAILIYRKYKLLNRIVISPKIIQLHFKLLESDQSNLLILDIPPGHHIMMRAPNPEIRASDGFCNNSPYISRPYSPFRVDAEQLEFDILVNLSPGGKMSQYIEKLVVGDLVEFRGPVGSFYHEPNTYENLVIFTHGVAIAPILRIVDEILADEEDMTKIILFCCYTNLTNIFFREQLHEYNKFWNFDGNVFLSREICNICLGNEDASCEHFIKRLKYKESIHPFRLKSDEITNRLNKLNKGLCKVVICGSKTFEMFIVDALNKVEIKSEQIAVL